MSWINLHAHTEASISDGLFGPKKWVEALKDKGFKAHAVTDHGVTTSLYPFYKLARKEGITPILGCEFYYVDNPLLKAKENRRAQHLILIAKDYDGFRNLMRLQKLSFTDGFYFRPRIGLRWLQQYSEGLICLSACMGGVLSSEVFKEKSDDAETVLKAIGLEKKFQIFRAIFGDDFYVEFQGHAEDGQAEVNRAFYERLRKRSGFQPVVTNDCHYILPEHAKIQGYLKDMAYKKNNTEAGQSFTTCDSLWLKTPEQVADTFKRHHEYLPTSFVKEGMDNTMAIFEKVKDLELPEGKRYLPTFRKDKDSKELFTKLTAQLFAKFLKTGKLHTSKEEYKKRFIREFRVITKYKLEDYFLIVWDLLRFARSKGIYTPTGRGSAAGCFISYLMGIVRLDPLEYGLFFERFLNANRCESGELPDIDLDFESLRRQEIKDYIFDTYGRDKVCEIGTYGRLQLKSALADFGKQLGVVTHQEITAITTKLDLPKELANDLEAAVDQSTKLKEIMTANEDYVFVVEEIIGQIKSQSIHPAGVVVCSENISEVTPLKTQKDSETGERVITTQSEDKYIIDQGLVKLDILGLKEYDIIKSVVSYSTVLEHNTWYEQIMNDRTGPLHEKVWEFFKDGRTDGVFQFGSGGMQELLIDMEPDSINDLIAANALYRPGCLENGWHTQYCRRKRGEEKVEYVHPILEETLKETYGVIIYQEQFMETFHRLGGISLVDSDTIRSALGKKDKAKLDGFKKRFVAGASKHIGVKAAEDLWDQLEKASGYTFNKSHSAAYSILAYISQYLKVLHPEAFYCAQLQWAKEENLTTYIKAANDMGISIEPPNINISRAAFFVRGKKPVWSFSAIKGVGVKTAKEIQMHQPFSSFDDFYKRVNKSKVQFKHMVNLIYSGALDDFGDRKVLLKDLYEMQNSKKGSAKKQVLPKLTESHMMLKFVEMIGYFERSIKDVYSSLFGECHSLGDVEAAKEGRVVIVGGMIKSLRTIKTKSGEPMAFATLIDKDEHFELTFFPGSWVKWRSLVKEGSVLQVTGDKSVYQGKENQVQVNFVESIL